MSTEIPNQSADFVAREEGKMWVYRNGEISHGSAVSRGTIHVTQGLHVNWGEPIISCESVITGMPNNGKGRMANG